jgi:hypothetical protein
LFSKIVVHLNRSTTAAQKRPLEESSNTPATACALAAQPCPAC